MKWLILAALLAVIVIAAVQTVRRFRKGGGCCGAHETVKLRPVSDKNPSHYPYRAEAEIGGMTCANCAVRVANALNKLDGVWAEVSFDKKAAWCAAGKSSRRAPSEMPCGMPAMW